MYLISEALFLNLGTWQCKRRQKKFSALLFLSTDEDSKKCPLRRCNKSNQNYLDLVFFSRSLDQDKSVINYIIKDSVEEQIFS